MGVQNGRSQNRLPEASKPRLKSSKLSPSFENRANQTMNTLGAVVLGSMSGNGRRRECEHPPNHHIIQGVPSSAHAAHYVLSEGSEKPTGRTSVPRYVATRFMCMRDFQRACGRGGICGEV